MKNWLILAFSLLCLGLVIEELFTRGLIDDFVGPMDEDFATIIVSIISFLGFFYLWKKDFFKKD